MVNMTFQLDEDLHNDFKLFCYKRRLSMREVMVRSIKVLLKKKKIN